MLKKMMSSEEMAETKLPSKGPRFRTTSGNSFTEEEATKF